MKDINGIELKVGDKVRVVEEAVGGSFAVGYEGFVTQDLPIVTLDGNYESGSFWDYDSLGGGLEIISSKYPNPPHKHAEVIKAWADGADLQYNGNGKWKDYKSDPNLSPAWTCFDWRIKPSKSPEELEKEFILSEMEKLKERLAKLEVKGS